jgi:Short C-terminal domain/Domain of unknown function (DUF4429)
VSLTHQSIQWTIKATPAETANEIMAAAKALKYKANEVAAGQILVEAPFSLRTNTFAGKYAATVIADGTSSVVVWVIEGQGSNQPKNVQRLAEKLSAGILIDAAIMEAESVGPDSDGDREAAYRLKHGIPDGLTLAIGVDGYCAFDGQFLTLQHVGLGRLTVGKGVKRIPVGYVSAVQVKPAGAVISGFIQFTLPGGIERRSEFGRQTFDAVGDENSIVFIRDQEASFLAFRDALESVIAARHNPSAPVAVAALPSVLDQISQLAGLRDVGILTPAEFDEKKAELLSRL